MLPTVVGDRYRLEETVSRRVGKRPPNLPARKARLYNYPV